MSGKGREAPKSLNVIGVIEASANIRSRECECEFACVRLSALSLCVSVSPGT